ncbi:MAG: 30S ribosomal protein S16 [Candidatus Hydrogenedentes bacterium]|nr:30S ribosomal protein S16 [Candidatus Hydrogenedentota bacterium]
MSTKIRLKRGGRKSKPYYRIVVQDSRVRRDGPELEIIGFYHPAARPEPVSEVNVHRALDWLKKGAEMSDTARSILSKLGVLRHHHDGTVPEETTATLTGGVVENRGYNAPPPPEEEKPEVVEEVVAEEVPADAVADVAAESDPVEADAETDAS